MQSPEISPTPADKIIVRALNFHLDAPLRTAALEKASRLLRHEDSIVRIHIDLELDRTGDAGDQFIAKGHIEIGGPDLLASVATPNALQSLELLVDKLDRLIRRRHTMNKDFRNHPKAVELGVPLPKAV
jgi:putative sigma-54 modulation protein